MLQGWIDSAVTACIRHSKLVIAAALVVAALCARGTTVLDNIYHLDRGYQDIVRKLEALGAHITRVDGEAADQDLSRVVGD